MALDYLDHYREHGYAVVRGVFHLDEVMDLEHAFDRVYQLGMTHTRSYRHKNVLFRIADDANLGHLVRMVQWPSYFDALLNRFRCDPRMLDIIAPLIGRNVKQIINQMHWKPPGAAMTEFGYHQDFYFRQPAKAYRNPMQSYVQTGIAVDPHSEANGAITVFPGSHLRGPLIIGDDRRIMDTPLNEDELEEAGLDPAKLVRLDLEPGDVGLWHLCTVHGSGPNHSATDRRLYINGYVTADNCDRGEWTFRDGKSCRLGEPVLVHFEELYSRPEPHYLDP